jgi:sigma-B regulation protein RsbU (phosphoserine phosphatase)
MGTEPHVGHGAQGALSLSLHQVVQEWRDAVDRLPRAPHVDAAMEASTRRLLELCEQYCADPSETITEDAYRVAYALAHAALEDMGQKTVIAVFRDALVEAILAPGSIGPGCMTELVAFFDILSDAYWQAYTDNLKRTIRNQAAENIAKELRVAKYIQQYLLPRKIPKIEGYEFAGRLVPAAEVGGDYWSVKYYEQDGIVTFKLADIAGHGIASATLVAAVKFISGGYYQGAKTAASVMQKTNHVLVKETPSDILVTMVYGWLHPESGDINIVNAGHSPVFIQRGEHAIDIEPTGPVLGLAESRYGERRLHLDVGDIVFTCSDGITEARRGKEIFGVDRVKAVVTENRDLPPDALIDTVINAAQEFSGGVTDDMSALVIRVLEDGNKGRWRLPLPETALD